MIQFKIITLGPKLIEAYLSSHKIMSRAVEQGLVKVTIVDLREFGIGTRKNVDDKPYGGAESPILRPDVCEQALLSVLESNSRVIHLSPKGRRMNALFAKELGEKEDLDLIFLCGRYGGFDERFLKRYVHEEWSIGDFVVSSGEIACLPLLDSILRWVPGVIQKPMHILEDSFSQGTLEGPQYTRPHEFHGEKIPDVFLSGHHSNIQKSRKESSLKETANKRPDLF